MRRWRRDGGILAHLEVAQPQLALLVFQRPFDRPAAKAHVQDHFQRHCARGVGQEVFDGVPRHDPLRRVTQSLVIPLRERKKLLQSPRRNLGHVGDRLDTLAGKVAELSTYVLLEMIPCLKVDKAIGKLIEITR